MQPVPSDKSTHTITLGYFTIHLNSILLLVYVFISLARPFLAHLIFLNLVIIITLFAEHKLRSCTSHYLLPWYLCFLNASTSVLGPRVLVLRFPEIFISPQVWCNNLKYAINASFQSYKFIIHKYPYYRR